MIKLIQEAQSIIELRYQKDKHTVGAALQTKSGKVYTGISVNGQKLDLCAEWSALSRAFIDGEQELDAIVAVHKKKDGSLKIYPPCSLCRELFITHCPDIKVILAEDKICPATDLLPSAWKR